ncbi:globin [Wenzhouxiangella sp. XN79A]|uniref:globin domain-containing protein n=1 Tax=Wenzhouxiangella sp. XN79A TaxID=2724193 RepID=UPI00144AF2F4|nr:globin domain-containing protein [Wenzhouxiangella sp. XN79A]NKI35718.1 globin [Wenzhouxiangella sp. XN79A]
MVQAALALNDAERVERFHASLERAGADPAFLDRFYSAFQAVSPEIEAMFRDTDMSRLKRKLEASLHLVTLAIDEEPGARDYLEYLGRVHARFALQPEHFRLWIDALVATVADTDPAFDAGLEQDWRGVLSAAIQRMDKGLDRGLRRRA